MASPSPASSSSAVSSSPRASSPRASSPIAPDDLRIRRAEPSDHVALHGIMGGRSAQSNTLQSPFPSLEQWHERMAKPDPQDCMLVAEARSSSIEPFQVVGHLGLNVMKQERRAHAAALGMSIHDAWQGRGIGSALMTAALDRADNWMNVLRIELSVFVDNARAIALYRRHGFVVEGTHRAYALKDGDFVDSYAMARLHPRPPTLPIVTAS